MQCLDSYLSLDRATVTPSRKSAGRIQLPAIRTICSTDSISQYPDLSAVIYYNRAFVVIRRLLTLTAKDRLPDAPLLSLLIPPFGTCQRMPRVTGSSRVSGVKFRETLS